MKTVDGHYFRSNLEYVSIGVIHILQRVPKKMRVQRNIIHADWNNFISQEDYFYIRATLGVKEVDYCNRQKIRLRFLNYFYSTTFPQSKNVF